MFVISFVIVHVNIVFVMLVIRLAMMLVIILYMCAMLGLSSVILLFMLYMCVMPCIRRVL